MCPSIGTSDTNLEFIQWAIPYSRRKPSLRPTESNVATKQPVRICHRLKINTVNGFGVVDNNYITCIQESQPNL